MQKIRQDDEVIVIAGRDKGRRGEVQRVLPNGRVLVGGINIVKKHVKANPQINEQGGIREMEAPIDASNVAIFNPESNKPDRVGIRVNEEGERERFFKSNNEPIDL